MQGVADRMLLERGEEFMAVVVIFLLIKLIRTASELSRDIAALERRVKDFRTV